MESQNLSDLIEHYLKQILEQSGQVEIRRADIALRFNCVPSQINYVIKTRFTIPKGYVVESKRGGGGYIRIEKVQLLEDVNLLEELHDGIEDQLAFDECVAVIQTLFQQNKLTKKEGELFLAVCHNQTLQLNLKDANQLRSRMMKALLMRLRYEEKE